MTAEPIAAADDEDMDEAMAWLQELEADQGSEDDDLMDLLVAAEPEPVDPTPEAEPEKDELTAALDWLEEVALQGAKPAATTAAVTEKPVSLQGSVDPCCSSF